MKIRYKWPQMFAMSDTGANAGSTDEGGQQQNQQGQQDQSGQQQQQQQKKDNDKDNDDNFETLWQDENADAGGQKQTPQKQAPQQQQQQQQQEPSAEETFGKYITSLNLTKDVDLTKISEELNQGKTEGLGTAFSAIAAQTYRQAMVDMSKVIDQKVAAGIEAAVTKSSNAVHGDMAVRQMNTTLEFTQNPAIAPIANAALAQLIKKGKTVDEAVESVRAFFTKTSQLSAKELKLQNPPRGRPGNQPFNGAGDVGNDEEETDWMDTLGV